MSPKVSNEYKENKKKEILLHAKKVFQRKGFEPTTMKDIKEEASISFGGLYMYFSNTEEIFLQLLELEYQINDEQIKNCNSEFLWDHIKHFINIQKQELKTIRETLIPITYEYFVTAWREKQRIPFLEKRYIIANTKLMDLLNMGIESGEFNPVVPIENLCKLLISTLEGLNVSSLFLEEDVANFEKQLDTLQRLLEYALQINHSDD